MTELKTQRDLRRSRVGDAGYDIATPVDLSFKAGKWQTVDLQLYLTEDVKVTCEDRYTMYDCLHWFMMIVPRSSMGKYGLRLANTVGIIDSRYVGPENTIKAKLRTDRDVDFPAGTRILQGIIIPYGVFADEIPPEEEREGGIGSTGA